MNHLPIGVFDSGVGGLTVLRSLKQALPNESFLYLGDTARLPYGTKSADTIIRYTTQVSEFLFNQGIKCLVVACNTASAIAIDALQQRHPEVPIIGVLEPGAKAAALASKTGRIAVIATEATVNTESYNKAIKNLNPNAEVIAQSCSLLVALAEEGWTQGEIARAILKEYLIPLLHGDNHLKPDCLVLGCTHFPTLYTLIKEIAGDHVEVVDSANVTAIFVATLLQQKNILNSVIDYPITTRFLVTDAPKRFQKIAKVFLDSDINLEDIQLIDF